MRYVMKQKVICFGNDFSIKDDRGHLAYFVDGKGFTYGQKLSVQDAFKNEVAYISEHLVSLVKTFTIYQNNVAVAVIKKKPFTMREHFDIDCPGGEPLRVSGNLLAYDYKMYRGPELLASVYKRKMAFTDTYEIDVHAEKETVLLLCGAVVVDLVCHND